LVKLPDQLRGVLICRIGIEEALAIGEVFRFLSELVHEPHEISTASSLLTWIPGMDVLRCVEKDDTIE
jgi:hypothetical protein